MESNKAERSPGFLARFILILAGVVAALAVAEVGLRITNRIGCPVFRPDKNCGYVARPDQFVGGIHQYHINRYGLRGPEFPETPPPGTARVGFVGDSITFGGGHVSDSQTFVQLSAHKLSQMISEPVEGINISEPGWGPQNMEGYVTHDGVYGSNPVVWVISAVDFRRRKNTIQSLDFLRKEPPLKLMCLARFGWNLLQTRWSRVERRVESTAGRGRASRHVLVANLNAFRRGLGFLRERGIMQVVIFVPAAHEASFSADDLRAYRSIAHDDGIQTYALDSAFRHRDDQLFYDGVHLTPAGHAVVAKEVVQALSQWAQSQRTKVAANRGSHQP